MVPCCASQPSLKLFAAWASTHTSLPKLCSITIFGILIAYWSSWDGRSLSVAFDPNDQLMGNIPGRRGMWSWSMLGASYLGTAHHTIQLCCKSCLFAFAGLLGLSCHVCHCSFAHPPYPTPVPSWSTYHHKSTYPYHRSI